MSEVFDNDIDQIDISELEDDIVVEEENVVFEYPDPLYKLKLEYSSEGVYATTTNTNLELNPGDSVIIPTRYGKDLALVMGKVTVPIGIKQGDIVYVERKASKEDLKRAEELKQKEISAFSIFKEKVAAHKLDMKLIATH